MGVQIALNSLLVGDLMKMLHGENSRHPPGVGNATLHVSIRCFCQS